MDPVLQVFQQQQSGSAGGEGFGQFAAEGARLNLSRRHLALQERQQAQQDQLFPLQKQLLENKAISEAAAMGTVATYSDSVAAMNMVLPKVNSLFTKFTTTEGGFTNDALLLEFNDLYAQAPQAFVAGRGKQIVDNILAVQAQRRAVFSIIQNERKMKEQGSALFISGYDKEGMPSDVRLREDDIRRQRLQNEVTRLNLEARRLEQAGDRIGLASVRQQLAGLMAGYNIEGLPNVQFSGQSPQAPQAPAVDAINPSTVAPTPASITTTNTPITFQKIDRPLTAGQEGTLKETAAYAVDTAKRIEDVKGMADTIFGPAAALGEIVVDKALANIAPELVNKERVRGREAARYVKEGIYRSLNKGQGVLSDKDVQRLNELYPALKGLDQAIESPARAKVVLSSLQQQIAQDAYAKTRLRGIRPDAESLSFLPPRFIREEFEAGRITEDEARAAINASPYQDEITEEINRGRKR